MIVHFSHWECFSGWVGGSMMANCTNRPHDYAFRYVL